MPELYLLIMSSSVHRFFYLWYNFLVTPNYIVITYNPQLILITKDDVYYKLVFY